MACWILGFFFFPCKKKCILFCAQMSNYPGNNCLRTHSPGGAKSSPMGRERPPEGGGRGAQKGFRASPGSEQRRKHEACAAWERRKRVCTLNTLPATLFFMLEFQSWGSSGGNWVVGTERGGLARAELSGRLQPGPAGGGSRRGTDSVWQSWVCRRGRRFRPRLPRKRCHTVAFRCDGVGCWRAVRV